MTKKSTSNYSDDLTKIKEILANTDTIMIGAGAGLSTSAGFVYDGENFKKSFSDFAEKYGFHDMYSGGFYPYDSLEEYWAYWSRYIWVNRYADTSKTAYDTLFELVKDKDYFILTTNVDHQFQKTGFDKKRLFYTQGDYGLFQCSTPCCNETFENKEIIVSMLEQQEDMRIPSELIPICPHCGKPLTMNLRSDNNFVQDKGWNIANDNYDAFVRRNKKSNIVYLELGVGYNTPSIIKYNFCDMTYYNQNAHYICINFGEASAPKEIENQSICINDDIGKILKILQEVN